MPDLEAAERRDYARRAARRLIRSSRGHGRRLSDLHSRRCRPRSIAAPAVDRGGDLCVGRVQPGPDPSAERQPPADGADRRGAARSGEGWSRALDSMDCGRIPARSLPARGSRSRRSPPVRPPQGAGLLQSRAGADFALVAAAGGADAGRADDRRRSITIVRSSLPPNISITASRTRGSRASAGATT